MKLPQKVIVSIFLFLFTLLSFSAISSIKVYASTKVWSESDYQAFITYSSGYKYHFILETTYNGAVHLRGLASNSPICVMGSEGQTLYHAAIQGSQFIQCNEDNGTWSLNSNQNTIPTSSYVAYYVYADGDIYTLQNNTSSSNTTNISPIWKKTTTENIITYPPQYLTDGTSMECPYYIVTNESTGLYFSVSNKPFLVDSNNKVRFGRTGYYYHSGDGGKTWEEKVPYGDTLSVLYVTQPIIYNNGDIYRTTVTDEASPYNTLSASKTSEIVYHDNPIPNLTVQKYEYQFDSSVPDIQDPRIERIAVFGIGPFKAYSKGKYNVAWTKPVDMDLKMEISWGATLNSVSKVYKDQTYVVGYHDDGTFVYPQDGKFEFNINTMATLMHDKLFPDSQMNVVNKIMGIVPDKLYIRYIKIDDINKKIKYGDWTRLNLHLSDDGIMSSTIDTSVKNNEVENPDDTVSYTDDEKTDNNKTLTSDGDRETVDPIDGDAINSVMNNSLETSLQSIDSVSEFIGEIPALIGKMFTFLPGQINTLLALGVALIIVLRVAGR